MPRALELINQNIPASTAKPVQTPAKTVSTTPAPTAKPIATTKAPVKLSDYSINEVIIMQNIIISLSNTMVKNAEFISKEIEVLTKEDVINYATSFQKMGRINNAPTDGVWGPNTNKVLTNINSFLYRIGSNLKVEIGPGEYPFKGNQEELKKLAVNNLNVINSVFGELGVNKPADQIDKTKQTELGSAGEFDRIKQTLSLKDAEDPTSFGDVLVTEADLRHPVSFYFFIQTLKADWFTSCDPLDIYLKTASVNEKLSVEKASLEILNNSIFKISQEVTPEAPKPISKPEAPSSISNRGVCFSFLDGVLSWFMTRSDTVYNAYKNDKTKAALAKDYRLAVYNLVVQWKTINPYIIEQIKLKKAENKPVITIEMFQGASNALAKKNQQKGQLISYKTDGETGVTQSTGRGQDKLIGPIQTTMNIGTMISEEGYGKYFEQETLDIAAEIKKRSSNGVLPVLEAGEWSNSANWKFLAHDYVLAKSDVEAERKFEEYAKLINQFLYSALGDWLRSPYIYNKIPLENQKAQRLILSNWSRYINNLIREAQYYARNPEGTQQRKWTGAFG